MTVYISRGFPKKRNMKLVNMELIQQEETPVSTEAIEAAFDVVEKQEDSLPVSEKKKKKE